MKRFAAIAMLVMAANAFSPMLPQAHAANIADTLAALAAQNPALANAQQLAQLKQDIDQGGKTALIGLLSKAATAQTGSNELAGVISAVAGGVDPRGVVAFTVRQQVQQRIDAKLVPYQTKLDQISQILQNTGLIPKAAANNNSLAGAPANYRQLINMTATAYGPGYEDNGRWNDLTYVGGKVRKGVAAVDQTVIPLGTRLWVEGYGEAIAEDEGSAIKGNRIDLAFNNRQEALDYGIKPVKVYILK